MKITIDTETKEVIIEVGTSLQEAVTYLQKHFPDEWMHFKIANSNIIISLPYIDEEPGSIFDTFNCPN